MLRQCDYFGQEEMSYLLKTNWGRIQHHRAFTGVARHLWDGTCNVAASHRARDRNSKKLQNVFGNAIAATTRSFPQHSELAEQGSRRPFGFALPVLTMHWSHFCFTCQLPKRVAVEQPNLFAVFSPSSFLTSAPSSEPSVSSQPTAASCLPSPAGRVE